MLDLLKSIILLLIIFSHRISAQKEDILIPTFQPPTTKRANPFANHGVGKNYETLPLAGRHSLSQLYFTQAFLERVIFLYAYLCEVHVYT